MRKSCFSAKNDDFFENFARFSTLNVNISETICRRAEQWLWARSSRSVACSSESLMQLSQVVSEIFAFEANGLLQIFEKSEAFPLNGDISGTSGRRAEQLSMAGSFSFDLNAHKI